MSRLADIAQEAGAGGRSGAVGDPVCGSSIERVSR